ncbi:glycogen synthase GlgA [Haloimpatiens sp. FM7330]|uniref:glycogen synthase GlgA n=1 Tax=Haloimpatiens sp. FM7330 TaxID=3298610 RepID=UPI00363A3F38
MKVLFVCTESHPFIKIGGLGDVAYALPKALRKMGVDVRVIIPKYSDISSNFKTKMKHIDSFNVKVAWRNQYCGLEYLEYSGIPYYFVDNEYYFKRDGIYGFYDDGERFAYFCDAVIESIKHMGDFKPDVIHCNDWHTGMIPVFMKDNSIKTVFTIHNLKYQGVFGKEILGDILGLSDEYFSENKLKYYDGISFMKGGINYADLVTTVSNSYAKEIKTPYYGEGLHGLLENRGAKFLGVVNGIDYDVFNPKDDKEIYFNYNINHLDNKLRNKIELQRELKLPVNRDIPMIGIVSRLVKQKGLDLIAEVIEELLGMDIQIVVLGTGEMHYEDLIQYYSYIYPSKISSNIYFSNEMAKKIYASCDMFLMPSLFEPCGIGQLIAQRYGTLPIVRETGGLKETVLPFNKYTRKGTGFSFKNYNSRELIKTIKNAVSVYKDKKLWKEIMQQVMEKDNSWQNSAKTYKEIYKNLIYN